MVMKLDAIDPIDNFLYMIVYTIIVFLHPLINLFIYLFIF